MVNIYSSGCLMCLSPSVISQCTSFINIMTCSYFDRNWLILLVLLQPNLFLLIISQMALDPIEYSLKKHRSALFSPLLNNLPIILYSLKDVYCYYQQNIRMKGNNKNPTAVNYLCAEHKEKCSFVCLFKTCNNAFKIGCSKCKKDHAQHPNRLVPIVDFHTMLGKPIKYLQDISAFKLMNLKKKIEFIRNFRGYILQKEIQLIESNKNIKQIISSLLEEHYSIRDTVGHLDTQSLINDSQQYMANLYKCKDFMAFNPVKCELVFNNDVIKNSRVSLEKQIKSSHELIDNIRQFLVKIIQVLLANCAHDQDDQDIQFVQEGDDKTNFNIYIKNRIDVIENPNIKSKLQHTTFLQMFDEQKQALTKEVQLLERQIYSKSSILKKIKSLNGKDEEQILMLMNKNKQEQDNDLIENLHYQNQQLKSEIAFIKQSSDDNSNDNVLMDEQLNQIKMHYQEQLYQRQCQITKINEYGTLLQEKLEEISKQRKFSSEKQNLNVQKIKKFESQLNIQRQNVEQSNKKLKKLAKTYEQKIKLLKVENTKVQQQLNVFQKKNKSIQIDLKKKKQQCESYKANKVNLEQKIIKYKEIQVKYLKISDQLETKQKQMLKLVKKIEENEKSIQKLKDNYSCLQKQVLNIKQQFTNKQKILKMQLDKSQKENEVLKLKGKNEEQRFKNIDNRMKQTLKQIQYKNGLIRQKDKIIREKQQAWNSKSQVQISRVKELEYQLKNSRHVVDNSGNTEEIKKYRQVKQLFQLSIKKNQQLKDKNYQLQTQLQILKIKKLEDEKKNSFNSANGRHSLGGVVQRKSFLHEQKLQTNNSSLFAPECFKIQTVTSQQYVNSPKKDHEEHALKQIKILTNKNERKQAYMQIKNMFNTVSEDMGLLEERLKENSVIQKVYLKQLERKRNENKVLKKELQSMKVYGGNQKVPTQANRIITPKAVVLVPQKQKKDNFIIQNSSTNAPTQKNHGQNNLYLAQRRGKN